MLASNKIIGFVAATDYQAARDFYEGKLGLKFRSQDQFALVLESGGHMVRIAQVPGLKPVAFTVLGWETSDIENEVRQLQEKGIGFERYPWMPASDLPIWAAPGGDKVAWFKDPDGNVLSLSQHA
jgi:catechol 2,3-dioxygenase-like lactoylglutathione lyase family enzyme